MGIEQQLGREGFQDAKFRLVKDIGNKLRLEPKDASITNMKNVMYALLYRNRIFYIGETKRTLRERFQGYITPSKKRGEQKTNEKVHGYMLKHSPVRVFYRGITSSGLNSNATERFLARLLNGR